MLAVLGGEIWDDPSEAVIEEKDGLFRLARPLSQSDYLGMIEAAAVVWAVRDRVEGLSSTVDVAMHFGRPTIVSAINVSQPGSPVGPAANGWIRQIRVRSLAESSERSMFRMSNGSTRRVVLEDSRGRWTRSRDDDDSRRRIFRAVFVPGTRLDKVRRSMFGGSRRPAVSPDSGKRRVSGDLRPVTKSRDRPRGVHS